MFYRNKEPNPGITHVRFDLAGSGPFANVVARYETHRAVMGDLPTQRGLATAHDRRVRIIAQLQEQAIATVNDLSATKAKIAKWLFVVGTVLLALGCFAAGWIVA